MPTALDLRDALVVVTGGGSGLGAGLCRRFAAEGGRVVVVDRNLDGAREVAAEVDGLAVEADVGVETDIQRAVATAVSWADRPVDVMVSNAGVGVPAGIFDADEEWHREWRVHVMSNIYAARAVLPSMLERRSGWLVSTASGVSLTCQPDTGPYVVSKHAQLALAEFIALSYPGSGVQVSCICPLGMATGMTVQQGNTADLVINDALMSADEAAGRAIAQLREGRFLVLTHPEVATYAQRRAADHDRWLAGMQRFYARLGRN